MKLPPGRSVGGAFRGESGGRADGVEEEAEERERGDHPSNQRLYLIMK